MITIGLVDDHQITRKGIKTVIELHHSIKVVLEASNGRELLDQLADAGTIPNIVILDITMPVMNGFTALEELREKYPAVKIIIFSLLYEEDTVINMITQGACGYISKSADPSALAEAIIAVHARGFYLGELVKKGYFRKRSQGKAKPGFHGRHFLSTKEIEFIRLASTSQNYREIAETMELSPKTIENYRDSLFQKLHIKNRASLVIYGFKNGLIDIFS